MHMGSIRQAHDQLKGSPVIRRFEGTLEDFRKHWQEAVKPPKVGFRTSMRWIRR